MFHGINSRYYQHFKIPFVLYIFLTINESSAFPYLREVRYVKHTFSHSPGLSPVTVSYFSDLWLTTGTYFGKNFVRFEFIKSILTTQGRRNIRICPEGSVSEKFIYVTSSLPRLFLLDAVKRRPANFISTRLQCCYITDDSKLIFTRSQRTSTS